MPKTSFLRNYRKTSKTPRRPFEKERIDGELKLVGEYGLRCKRELWRTQLALAKLRKAARTLLTLDTKDPARMFEAPALLRRLQRYGLLDETELELDAVLQMTTQRLLERRVPPDHICQTSERRGEPRAVPPHRNHVRPVAPLIIQRMVVAAPQR